MSEFLTDLSNLSSGTTEEGAAPTLFSELFNFLAASGTWADAVSKLLGLVA